MMAFNELDIPIAVFIALALLVIAMVILINRVVWKLSRGGTSSGRKLRQLAEESSVEMGRLAREEGYALDAGTGRGPEGTAGKGEPGAYVIRLTGDEAPAGPHENRDGVPTPGQ